MSLMEDWQAQQAQEELDLFERLRTSLLDGTVTLLPDLQVLGCKDSPLYNVWDQLAPLLVMMSLAMLVLLFGGLVAGLVAMAAATLIQVFMVPFWVRWCLSQRMLKIMLLNIDHWMHVWSLGGVCLTTRSAIEPPCFAPRGDWRKFTRRVLTAQMMGRNGRDAPE